MNFPATNFASEVIPVRDLPLELYGQQAVDMLAQAEMEVVAGANATHAAGIAEIAGQDGVRAFCHNDIDNRVGTADMLAEWENGGDGTQMFLLREAGGLAVAESVVGYGWTRPEENEYVPGGRTAFAIRLSKRVAGRGLALPFTNAMVASTVALGGRNVHLSTFKGNPAAWKTYRRAGAVDVAEHPDVRHAVESVDGVPDGTLISETRLYQIFPHTFEDAA